jgi:DNA recombination protein Rad52
MDPSTTPGSAIGSSSSNASSNEYGIGGVTLTASEVSAIAARLSASIDPSLMKLRTVGGGKQAAYLPADEIFGVANESFGFHRWACNIKDLKLMHATREDSGQWTIAYMCTMRVTFFDNGKPICFHEDVGYGTAERQPRADAAFELAVKSAVTDARKRCLRLFGPILGQNINSADFQKAAQDSAKISAQQHQSHQQHQHHKGGGGGMQQQSGPSVARTVALSTVSGFAPPPPPALSSSTSSSSFLPSTHTHPPISSMQNDHIGGTISTSTAFPSSTISVSGSTLSTSSSTIQQGVVGEGSGALDENSRKRRAEENRIAALAKRQKLAETSSAKGTISTTSGGTSSSTNSSSSSTVLLPISHSSPVASESVV